MAFNEGSRVRIPDILHLARLGYSYLSLKGASWEALPNIFPDLFRASLAKINPDAGPGDFDRLLQEISLLSGNANLLNIALEGVLFAFRKGRTPA